MLLGGILLASAVLVVVVLLARLAGGQPGAAERFSVAGLAIALILGSAGAFASKFLESDAAQPVNTENTSDPNSTLAQLPPQLIPLSETESQQLKWLHRASAEVFIDQPGFGMRRLDLPLQDVVTPPKLTSESLDVVQGQQGVESKMDAALKKLALGRDAHYSIRETINQRFGQIPTGDNQVWHVSSVQLVGLVKNPTPVVYESNKMPGMKDVKDLPKRDLNVFEARALESLRGGQHMVAEKSEKQIRMVAPIFAGNRCISCHDHKGQMLGAFSYVINFVPAPKKAE